MRTASRSQRLSPLEARAWTGLLRAHAEAVRDVGADLRAAHGLSLATFDVLREVASAPGGRIRMGALAARVRITPAGLSGLIDRLERTGLVERRRCDGDARGTYAALTRTGRRQAARAESTYRESVRRRYTSRFDDAELEFVGRVWERIAATSSPN